MKKIGLLFCVLALASCGSDDTSSSKTADLDKTVKHADKAKEQDPTKDLICPQVAILQAVDEILDYGGEAPDPSQLVSRAKMKSITGDCSYHKDGIDIAFTLHMASRKGPRLGGDQVSFPYFIVIVDPAENILSRQVMTAHFKFSGLDKVSVDEEPLHVFIPLSQTAMLAGPDYRVFVGFKKTQ